MLKRYPVNCLLFSLCALLLTAPGLAQGTRISRREISKTIRLKITVPPEVELQILQFEDERNLNGQKLIRMTLDENPAIRERAALAIGRIGDSAGTASLISLLEKDSDTGVRGMAAFALGELENDAAISSLLTVLDKEQENIALRTRIIEALGKIVSISPVAARLGDQQLDKINATIIAQLPVITTRPLPAQRSLTIACITALMRIRRESSVAPLAKLLQSPDPDIRGDAANALFRLRHPLAEAEAFLLKALTDRDWNVRANAARALGQSKDASVIDSLIRLLSDPSREVQVNAIRALAAINQPRATEALLTHGEAMLERLTPQLKNNAPRPVETNLLTEIASLLANNKQLTAEPVQNFVKKAYAVIWSPPAAEKAASTEQKQNHDDAYYQRVLSRTGKKPLAIIQTKRGNITLQLFPDDAPMTVDNFIELAKRGYFNGIVFHRVVPNFVIQGGDPTGTGNGGPGYRIRCEINQKPYRRGALGMALSGKDTGGSQFFITHSPAPHLDGGYTVFGQVLTGMNIVEQIVRGDVIEKVIIMEASPASETKRRTR